MKFVYNLRVSCFCLCGGKEAGAFKQRRAKRLGVSACGCYVCPQRQAVEALGVETAYIEYVAANADCEKAIHNLMDQGCNLIYTSSFGFMDWTWKSCAYWEGLSSGIVALDTLTPLNEPAVASMIDEASNEITNGVFDLFTSLSLYCQQVKQTENKEYPRIILISPIMNMEREERCCLNR